MGLYTDNRIDNEWRNSVREAMLAMFFEMMFLDEEIVLGIVMDGSNSQPVILSSCRTYIHIKTVQLLKSRHKMLDFELVGSLPGRAQTRSANFRRNHHKFTL